MVQLNQSLTNKEYPTILILEDDIPMSTYMRVTLEKEGYQVIQAFAGHQAFQNLPEYENNELLLLVDYYLPDMNGKEFIQRLERTIPFIMITGNERPETAVEMMKLGAADYIIKNESFLQIFLPTVKKISQQIALENRLQESESRFQTLLKSLDIVVWSASLQTGEILYISPVVERFLGISPHELDHNLWHHLIYKEDHPRVMEQLQNLYQNDSMDISYRIELEGKLMWLRDQRKIYRASRPKDDRIEGVTTDITKQKYVEAELNDYKHFLENMVIRRTQRIRDINKNLQQEIVLREQSERHLRKAKQEEETANKAKSEFLANMSHELRTPLNSIIGFSKLMARRHNPELYADRVNTIQTSGEHLLNLINDLLDLSKIEAGKISFDIDNCNLRSLVEEAKNLVQYQAQQKEIQFQITDEAPAHALTTPADCKRIKQVMLNLLSNAIKFSPDRSTITIRLKSASRYHFISVIDEGPGIEQKRRHWIFEQFNQIQDNGNSQEGTGLGLTISKRIIEAHNGSLTVKNCSTNKGSEFTIALKHSLPPTKDL